MRTMARFSGCTGTRRLTEEVGDTLACFATRTPGGWPVMFGKDEEAMCAKGD